MSPQFHSLAPAAESRHANFQTVNPVAQRTLELPPEVFQGHGLQALQLTAGLTLEMGVGRVMFAGQLKVGRGSLRGQLADQTQAHQIIQNAINGHLVHLTPGPDGVQDLPGLPGPALRPQGL